MFFVYLIDNMTCSSLQVNKEKTENMKKDLNFLEVRKASLKNQKRFVCEFE